MVRGFRWVAGLIGGFGWFVGWVVAVLGRVEMCEVPPVWRTVLVGGFLSGWVSRVGGGPGGW